jgi:hypothetical protein
VTSIGVIAVTRRYWKCRCGVAGSYAADEVLGLTDRLSKVVQKHACRLAADVSFAKTAEHLREMLGVNLSAEAIRTYVEMHGRAMAAFQPKDEVSSAIFREAKGKVEVAVDAGKVNTREEGWKDLKMAVISKRESGEPATPDQWEEDRLPAPTVALSCAMIGKSKVFRRAWAPALRRLGVSCFADVYGLGDGGNWIWKSFDRALPGCIQTLDIYHANQRVNRCAERIFGMSTAETKVAFEKGRALLVKDGWKGISDWVGELLGVEDVVERERRFPATEKLLNYFAKHVGRLNYKEQLANGRAIGSGAVEGEAKTQGLRMKARGARWLIKNVRPVASLVCVRNSVQWDAYWLAA